MPSKKAVSTKKKTVARKTMGAGAGLPPAPAARSHAKKTKTASGRAG